MVELFLLAFNLYPNCCDQPLAAVLEAEKKHFRKLLEVFQRKDAAIDSEVDEENNQLLDTIPPQVHQV